MYCAYISQANIHTETRNLHAYNVNVNDLYTHDITIITNNNKREVKKFIRFLCFDAYFTSQTLLLYSENSKS